MSRASTSASPAAAPPSAPLPALFAYNALTVGIGEAIACCVLGLLLLEVMPRIPALRGRLAVR